jgi:DNA-binding IclR family transcriptional regulator
MISDKELSKIANTANFSRGQFYNVVHDMISMGILRRSEFGDYELSTDFSSALSRMANSYRDAVKSFVKK